jgi:membrane-associated PAP2 superfamily phosphatase
MSKRRFWQIHLSTAVVLMLVIGFMMPTFIDTISDWTHDLERGGAYLDQQHWYVLRLLFTVIIIILAVGTWECFIRRREARKP